MLLLIPVMPLLESETTLGLFNWLTSRLVVEVCMEPFVLHVYVMYGVATHAMQ